MISSYVRDDWYTAGDEGTTLVDASTGEAVARVSSTGVDLGGMVEHARRVGGPGLRELTFHQRAAALKRLAVHLRERRELPNDVLYLDGPPEPLGRGGTFVGQRVYSSRPGVAVFVNAFNFPVWGMLEKLAPAVLAGVPAIVKPASQTAYVAELAFRHLVESGALPPGSVQLLCGGVGDLFDHLTGQDTIAFTGSAATARKLRCHPTVVREAELLRPRPRRRPRHRGAPAVHDRGGARADPEDGAEVHRHPARAGPGRARGCGGRRARRAAGRGAGGR